ncbi:hypothetical protein TWF694_002902 [Orbilia ellipsospora]|uniref:Rhodanese domain-containing protein n=1 Tax=Orbilia ellipsospora TaxID=2528407 RepID=A0AAV9X017_9PEZI
MQNQEDYARYGLSGPGPSLNPNRDPDQGDDIRQQGTQSSYLDLQWTENQDLEETFGWNGQSQDEPKGTRRLSLFLNQRQDAESESDPTVQQNRINPFAPAYVQAPRQYTYHPSNDRIEEEEEEEKKMPDPSQQSFRPDQAYYHNPNLQVGTEDVEIDSDRDYLEGTNEFEFDYTETEEDQINPGRKPSGQRSGQLSSRLSGSNQEFDIHGASRVNSFSNNPQFYRERGTNRLVRVRQLEYDEYFTDKPMTFPTVGAYNTLAAFQRRGVKVGRVTARQLYEYITRPGIRPTNYLILDARGEVGSVRLDAEMEQARGRVRVVPLSEGRSKLTDEEVEQLARLEPLSDSKCDEQIVKVLELIKNSNVEIIIVHCEIGNTRSPPAAAAIKMIVGEEKTVLLLEGGSKEFFKFVQEIKARNLRRVSTVQTEPTLRTNFQYQTSTAMTEGTPRMGTIENNPSLLILPGSPEHRLNRLGTSSILNNISPQFRRLVAGDRLSDYPWEEEDRAETSQLDGDLFIRHYGDDPQLRDNNCPPGGGPGRGPPPGPGAAMGGGFGGLGLGGGKGRSLKKRGLDQFDIAGGRLRKRSWGTFMPEPRGKGMRIVSRTL